MIGGEEEEVGEVPGDEKEDESAQDFPLEVHRTGRELPDDTGGGMEGIPEDTRAEDQQDA